MSDAVPFVVCRADGGPGIGGGHVARMAALAGAFRRAGGRVALATRGDAAPGFAETLTLAGDPDSEPAALARRWPGGADLLVVDHYGRDAGFEVACRPWARKILAVDDLAGRTHAADAVLQVAPPPGAPPSWPGAEALTGFAYAPLRRDIARARPTIRRAPGRPVGHVLISMGAVDGADATSQALAALAEAGFRGAADIALGRAAPHRARVAAALGRLPFRATLHVDADMPALIAAADLGLGAGGVGALERACLGLPGIVVPVADNQRPTAALLDVAGAARAVEDDLAAALARMLGDAAARRAQIDAAFATVDGFGPERVRLALAPPALADGAPVTLRRAWAADEERVFAWQRDPATRRYFRHPAPPTRAEHAAWFASVRADPARHLMIVEHGGEPAGTLRLDWQGCHGGADRYEISIAVAAERAGRGIGRAALAQARDLLPTAAFVAEILPGNAASLALFARAGYVDRGDGSHVSRPLRAEESP